MDNQSVAEAIQDFFGVELPGHISEDLAGREILMKATQKDIMEAIDFAPPFLRIEKIVILRTDREGVIKSKAISTGIMKQEDTEGHYNNTVFLAYCGRLMGQAASAHIGMLFPDTAPQVVKVDRIRPIKSEDDIIWRPNKEGSSFIIETVITRSKLHVSVVDSRFSFGDLVFGIANNATIVATPKESIYQAKDLPTS